MRLDEYERGYSDGQKMAVEWLHARANAMNDPHARQILHSAATNLGWRAAEGREFRRKRPQAAGQP